MRLGLQAQIALLLTFCGWVECAYASGHLPVRVVGSTVTTCPANQALVGPVRDGVPCLKLRLRWSVGTSEKKLQETHAVYSGPGMVDDITARYRLQAPMVFDAVAIHLGRNIQRRGKRKVLAQKALDQLFEADLIRCHRLLEDVSLTAAIERRVARLSFAYYRETGKQLVVTSGSRSPQAQASAMYRKLRLGVRLSKFYRSSAAREIEKAFLVAKGAGASRDAIVAAGAAIIRAQMDRGVFISKHLLDDAVDIRSRNLNRREKALFRKLARARGFRVLLETRPPHFHLSISNPEA